MISDIIIHRTGRDAPADGIHRLIQEELTFEAFLESLALIESNDPTVVEVINLL